MATFADLASDLTGRLPGLSPFLAESFILRAFRSIREERHWSWLVQDGAIVCPVLVSTGTFSYTQGGTTATADTPATAALASYPNPPGLTGVQIRFMGTTSTGEIYNILTATGNPLVITTDRAIQEATAAASPYLVYRAYVVPPVTDFQSWISLVDMVNGFALTKGDLRWTSAAFDARDPQRQAFGLAYRCGFYKPQAQGYSAATNQQPIYELWPGSTQGQTWYVRFRRSGTTPAMTDTVPGALPESLVLNKALAEHGYPHMLANNGNFPGMLKVDFKTLITVAQAEYRDRLQKTKLDDESIDLQSVYNRGQGLKTGRWPNGQFPIPIDSNWIQGHAIWW